MSVRVRKEVAELSAYELEPTGGMNLSNNASLFPPHPAITQALAALDPIELRDYPTLYGERLVAAIAQRHKVREDQIVTGNGSNDLIDLIIRTFADPGSSVAFHPPSFSMIDIWARTNGCQPLPIALGERWELDAETFANSGARVGILCRPNNPTGNSFPADQVAAVAEDLDGLVVVDEAYQSFSEHRSAERLLSEHDNLAIIRSLSKDHGLAGIRLGYAILDSELAAELRKVRGPFRVSAVTEAIAAAALSAPNINAGVITTVRSERKRVAAAARELGLEAFPSQANFILYNTPWDGAALQEALAGHGVLVRAFKGPRLATMVRATVGPAEANDRFLEALAAVVDGGGP